MPANSDCERLVRSRMTRTPEARMTVRREGFCRPRRIAPASRTLPSNSSNICFFTAELLFDNPGELRDLLRSRIRGKPGLESGVLLVGRQSADLPREDKSLNRLHESRLSA